MEKFIGAHQLKGILKNFPRNIKFSFAYGSAAFKQLSNQSNNMLDLIFVVRNVNQWHEENLELNPKHYAQPLKLFGHRAITNVQENWGAKLYYNTLVKMAGGYTIKYGVISEVSLIEDLLDWNDLYLAGRLHKPVKVLVEPNGQSQLPTALVQNLHSAVHAALLLLPQHFTEIDFYKTIASLSYNGDFRMTFGENKDKINNIVLPQLAQFRQLYSPILQHFENYVDIPKLDQMTVTCHQDTNPATKIHHLNQLPRTPQIKLVRAWSQGPRSKDTEDCLRTIAYDPECSEILEECLKQIVWRSSVTQSLKGIVTAGLVKSAKYSGAKIMKMLQSSPQTDLLPKTESDQSKVKKFVETVKNQTQPKETNKRIEYD
ncbi:phosphatidate cytidylyltransferase, mitochondrial isoform X1 [Megalopta genalis]|uniref:phosphatidate cytidylyltransferase, mitochondrial isoform X1 n=2 Tax=Megalopta genalis TaxID=115081 RepID=UPI003FD62751